MLPMLNVYSIEDFEELGNNNWLKCVWWYWIPIYTKPQNEDWDPDNSKKSRISAKLEENKNFFDKVLFLELENNSKRELINKWLNILAYFKK
jgi:hypothetical protein